MSEPATDGIRGVLDGLLSDQSRPGRCSAAGSEAVAQFKTPLEGEGPTGKGNVLRPSGVRRGRPLGKSNPAGLVKVKVTFWLNSHLVASYRDWSWEARSQFSHLVEDALTDYYRQRRNLEPVRR